jgi:hypothetical protein
MASNVLRREVRRSESPACLEVDFALILARVIDSAKQNPTELRSAIYELARTKLQREAWNSNPPMDLWEMRRLTIALETAIERVEAFSAKQDQLPALESPDRPIERVDGSARDPMANNSNSVLVIEEGPIANPLSALARQAHSVFSQLWFSCAPAPLLRACFVLILTLALYGTYSVGGRFFGSQNVGTDQAIPSPANETTVAEKSGRTPGPTPVKAAAPDLLSKAPVTGIPRPPSLPVQGQSRTFPLPTVYGIYAASHGELHELDVLPGRAPNERIFMSGVINKPSRTILADGRISFVAFRRDLATAAPDHVSVRVIATIMRAMIFNPRKQATVTKVNDQWAIRNIAYEFRVAPVSDNPEMIVIQPEDQDLVLPSGRYGLVLKDLVYDFTVAGEITEASQCLERAEAENGTFYSECRRPEPRGAVASP